MWVHLDIGARALREKVLQSLRDAGISSAPHGNAPTKPAAILRDISAVEPTRTAEPEVPTVHVWEDGRNPGLVAAGSVFSCSHLRHALGATPHLDPEVLRSTLEHLATGRFLGLARLLAPDAQVHTWYDDNSRRKEEHLRRAGRFLMQSGLRTSIRELMEVALDEMFTNAVYNAPVDGARVHINAATDRRQHVVCQRPFAVMFGCDQHRVGVAVRDYYGSLTVERVLERLCACYASGGARHEDKRGGAGLGLFLLLQGAERLAINIKPGQFTEVAVTNRRERHGREHRNSCPTFNLCAVDPERARATARQHFRMPVSWRVDVHGHGSSWDAAVCDISVDGAFVRCQPTRPAIGSVVELTSGGLESSSLNNRRARVCWHDRSTQHGSDGFGVRFATRMDVADVRPVDLPTAVTMAGQRENVVETLKTWAEGGQHSGEPVTLFYTVRTETGRILLLRYDTLRQVWAVKK